MNVIPVVSATDDNYSQHLGVMLQSLLTNTKTSIHIYIFDFGIAEKNKKRLRDISKSFNATIQFISFNHQLLKDFHTDKHVNEVTYLRVFIPEILTDLDKLIYLDCDLIIREDLSSLWSIEIPDYYLAAADNSNLNRNGDIGIPESSQYFNAGVMLINLEKWRNNTLTKSVLEYISGSTNHKIQLKYHDQDALNAVLYNNWYVLDAKWNYRESYKQNLYINNQFGYSSYQLFEAINNPSIVHYTEASKPWHYFNNHSFKHEYFNYLNQTGWMHYDYPERGNIEKILSSKKIIVFGIGKNGENLTNRLNELGYQVDFYLDNNPNLWGTIYYNCLVKAPKQLYDEKKEEIFIIIASMYYEEISLQLDEMGFENKKHYIVKGFENRLAK